MVDACLTCPTGLMGNCHKPVAASLPPTNTSSLLKQTPHSSSSNVTLQPASQNFPVEISDACASPGTMCASVIWSGSHGMSRLHVCVDLMIFPFGSAMAIGLVAGLTFTAGEPLIKKRPVAPESESAHLTALVSRS